MSSSNFSVTGIYPAALDFKTEYPVLAARVRHSLIVSGRLDLEPFPKRAVEQNYFSTTKHVYAKDSLFLIASRDGRFRWISPEKCNLFLPRLSSKFILHDKKRLTRYSLNKEMGEDKNMIIPMRPFSVTGISQEGFDSERGYPVLAIDVDQYFPETEENGEEEPAGEPSTQSMAVFLVANDAGEFAWIAEDECRLFSIDS